MSSIEKLGPYRIERALGRGGMGTVYAGVDSETGEQAAVKVLSSVLAANDAFRERFDAEIETLKTLRHPNIVQLYGYGEQDGHLFYAMELVQGTNLEEELYDGRRFDWRETTKIAIDVCRALKHAHDCGVIHRDLKPANLMIDQNDAIKLTDFGIAKLFGYTQLTVEGGVLGTADYMAPEQAEGESVSPRSDLYSLGSVMFALLSGRPPFRGKSLPDVLHMLKYTTPDRVKKYAPDVPKALDRVIAQLLEKDPARRIPTALALSNVLQATVHALSLESTSDADDPSGSEGPSATAETSFVVSQDGSPAPLVTGIDESIAQQPTMPMDRDKAAADPPLPTPSAPGPEHTLAGDGRGTTFDTGDEAGAIPGDDSANDLPEPASHFTMVNEDQLGRERDYPTGGDDRAAAWVRFAITVLVLLAAASGLWYATRPLSADQLHARIARVSNKDYSGSLDDAETDIAKFLERFPDDLRRPEIDQLRERIELDRSQRQFEFRARRLRDFASLSPVERAYLKSSDLAGTQPEAAIIQLEALIDVFGAEENPPDVARRCIDLATRQLKQLRVAVAASSKADRLTIERRLELADEIESTDRQTADSVRRGILLLYDGKPWAEELRQRARDALNGSSATHDDAVESPPEP